MLRDSEVQTSQRDVHISFCFVSPWKRIRSVLETTLFLSGVFSLPVNGALMPRLEASCWIRSPERTKRNCDLLGNSRYGGFRLQSTSQQSLRCFGNTGVMGLDVRDLVADASVLRNLKKKNKTKTTSLGHFTSRLQFVLVMRYLSH